MLIVRLATVTLLAGSILSPLCVTAAPRIIENTFGNASPGGTADPSGPSALLTRPGAAQGTTLQTSKVPSVWDMPQIQQRLVKFRLAMSALFKQQRFADAEKVAQAAVKLIPHDASGHYLLASAQACQGKHDLALLNLDKAIELGFNKSAQMSRDPNFKSLHENLRFAELIAAAGIAQPQPNPWERKVQPAPVVNGVATVSAANTGWGARHGVFVSLFKLSPTDAADKAPIATSGETALKINRWFREGTAAGNHGDYYDNHDGGHSSLGLASFPQMSRIIFAEDAKQRKLHAGLQVRMIHNAVVIGNSSTAIVNSPYWRSQARLAYIDKHSVSVMYLQYSNNQFYCYPEHQDYDEGKGDVFPANTPYVIVTQGSSWSDKPVLKAFATTLAAFRPEVKEFLVKHKALMPTMQLIARTCHDDIRTADDYLTGRAHPTAFRNGFNVGRMVESAHSLTKETTPPLAKLKVVEDDPSQVGRDYFDIGSRQDLFTTPCAIARVHRTTNYNYRMVVSAEGSSDLNGRDLKYHWKVLRGDADKIKITPVNEDGSVVEIVVPFHAKRPIAPGSKMQSNRVDIGCFVHNGLFYSAPAFVTFFSLANERRGYLETGKVAWVEYKDPAAGGSYVDPLVDVPKAWKDEYQYDDKDNLIGWTRQRNGERQHFTADGAVIIQRDTHGRAKVARSVVYKSHTPVPKKPPVLQQIMGNQHLYYEYASPEDKVGRLVRREEIGGG